MKLRRLDAGAPGFHEALGLLLDPGDGLDEAVERGAREIVEDVRARGDAALLECTRRFDRVEVADVASLEIHPREMAAALAALPGAQREALEEAARRIRDFHQLQRSGDWTRVEADGSRMGIRVTALERVGVYVPGGKAAYPSSVLMNAIPAQVAGVPEIVMVAPAPGGERNALVLAAAALAGVTRAFAIGGAQAVGALAYGTASVPAVDKIVGPGNAWVAAAKRIVFGRVGIDMIAGPSEILVLCDGSSDPEWAALDLFAQAEHDEMAQAILLSPDAGFLDRVDAAAARLLPAMPRRAIIEAALTRRGALVRVRDLDQACEIANRIAPEHLEICALEPRRWLERIRHAGAVFLGASTSEALGDYCAGPNHVLPTARTARFSSPLGVWDFQKRTSVLEVSAQGAARLGAIARELALGEGLAAHAQSAAARIPGGAASRAGSR